MYVYVNFTKCSDGNIGVYAFLEESLVDVGGCGLDPFPVEQGMRYEERE